MTAPLTPGVHTVIVDARLLESGKPIFHWHEENVILGIQPLTTAQDALALISWHAWPVVFDAEFKHTALLTHAHAHLLPPARGRGLEGEHGANWFARGGGQRTRPAALVRVQRPSRVPVGGLFAWAGAGAPDGRPGRARALM